MKLAILSEEKERIKSFLESLDLKYNEQDYSFYMEDGGRVIATVSVKGTSSKVSESLPNTGGKILPAG